MEIEENDNLGASQIQVKFISYKTPMGTVKQLPQKFYFQMRFFTFQPIMTSYMGIQAGQDVSARGVPSLKPGVPYFLMKSNTRVNNVQEQHASVKENMVNITFDIDPSISKVPDEHVRLAKYLKERYLTIDIFDAQTKFFFGSCKVPLFELLR